MNNNMGGFGGIGREKGLGTSDIRMKNEGADTGMHFE